MLFFLLQRQSFIPNLDRLCLLRSLPLSLCLSPPLSPSPELTFWFYVKEHLNRHELQRFYALRHISSELGRGRAWLRCALNEHSLERYLHTLLADRRRLGCVRVCVFLCVCLSVRERGSILCIAKYLSFICL